MSPSSDSSDLPPQLARFLADCIESVEQLELLVVIARMRERWWTARDLAEELWLSPAATGRDLEILAGRGLLEVRLANDLCYRLSPISAEGREAVTLLTELYPTRRVDILSSIVLRKGRALRHFAEAFRFRKDR